MATAMCDLSEEQFLCSICLDVFTDPVATPCGHNFCKNCIDRHWAYAAVYNCPYCKQAFTRRPALRVNIFISEMVQQFRSRARTSEQRPAGPGEVFCDLCPEPRLKALKSCLVCLSSYCEDHLQPHLSLPGLKIHQLMEPLKDLTERVCEKHNKPLELYCLLDQCCVCVHCMYTHKGHEVLPLKFSCEQQLKRTTGEIQLMIQNKEAKIQELRGSVKAGAYDADSEASEGVKVLRTLKDCVDKGLCKLAQDITKMKNSTEKQATDFIKELEQEISELKKKRSGLKQLFQTEDHFSVLKNISQFRSARGKKDWTKVIVHQPTYKGTVLRAVTKLQQEFNKTAKLLFEEDLRWAQRHTKYIRLDRDTAHPKLIVSNDGTEVHTQLFNSLVQDNPKRFDKGLYVLGTEGFCQTFYFEAVVSEKPEWTVGVAKETVNRKGEITVNPENGFWTLSLRFNSCFVSVDPKVNLLIKGRPDKVGVFVNYEDGIVSFYDVGAEYLIYFYTDCFFSEKLYPFFSPGSYSKCSLVMNSKLWPPPPPPSSGLGPVYNEDNDDDLYG